MFFGTEQATTHWKISRLSFLESGDVEAILTREVVFPDQSTYTVESKQVLIPKSVVESVIDSPTLVDVSIRTTIVTALISVLGF